MEAGCVNSMRIKVVTREIPPRPYSQDEGIFYKNERNMYFQEEQK